MLQVITNSSFQQMQQMQQNTLQHFAEMHNSNATIQRELLQQLANPNSPDPLRKFREEDPQFPKMLGKTRRIHEVATGLRRQKRAATPPTPCGDQLCNGGARRFCTRAHPARNDICILGCICGLPTTQVPTPKCGVGVIPGDWPLENERRFFELPCDGTILSQVPLPRTAPSIDDSFHRGTRSSNCPKSGQNTKTVFFRRRFETGVGRLP